MSALSFLRSLDATSAILLFWYTIVLEIPRYTIGAVVVCRDKPVEAPDFFSDLDRSDLERDTRRS